ncbi:MAG: diaminopimelate epimerase [Frankiales bacterium]|jgi:diaminopimelate epimerase|nr:diaminopimelate epimerase [Frankiales bacterium]
MSDAPALRYVKGHGTANDFVVLPDPDDALDLTPDLVRAICDRRRGIGADGVLRVVRAEFVPGHSNGDREARWFMDYRNADGSVAEMCGNGIRVFARYLVTAGFATPGSLRIATRDGVKAVEVGLEGDVIVGMGPARVLDIDGCAVDVDGTRLPGTGVSVGNPHVVVRVDDPAALGAFTAAPEISPIDAFPDGANVEFVATPEPKHLVVRVHERGVGETFSCGTGACAAVAAIRATNAEVDNGTTYTVDLPGGRLTVTACEEGRMLLAGPAVLVAQGVIREEWVAAQGALD